MNDLINEAAGSSVRKQIEADIYELMDDMDPSGRNSKRYRDLFATMDDKAFNKYMKDFFDNDRMNFTVAYMPIDDAKPFKFFNDIANKYNIELFEYMAMPYLNGDTKDPAVSLQKVFIGNIQVKRLFQMVNSKNSTSTTIDRRNMETGQTTDDDKHARMTDVETYSLLGQNQDAAAIEYAGLRADDMTQKTEFLTKVRADGIVHQSDLTSDEMNKTTFNVMNYYMLASGFRTNFIDSNKLLLPITIKGKEDKELINRGKE